MTGNLDDKRRRAFFLERFVEFLALEQGSSPRTQEAYARDIERMAEFAVAKGVPGPGELSARTLREFVYQLKDLGLAAASIRRNISAVRTYYKFLMAVGHVPQDPSEPR